MTTREIITALAAHSSGLPAEHNSLLPSNESKTANPAISFSSSRVNPRVYSPALGQGMNPHSTPYGSNLRPA